MGEQPRAESRMLTQALPKPVDYHELPSWPWHICFGPFDEKTKNPARHTRIIQMYEDSTVG
jgi:hypothetical protein